MQPTLLYTDNKIINTTTFIVHRQQKQRATPSICTLQLQHKTMTINLLTHKTSASHVAPRSM